MNEIRVGSKKIGNSHPVFVIAEAGINHNGSLKLAKQMIREAAKSGVDCIKFQTHIAEQEMLKSNITPGNISKKSLWSIIKQCEFSEIEQIQIKNYCKYYGILFLSTPFSIDAVNQLERLKLPAYKIGSGELTNIPFLEHIANTKKPVILSTGMSTISEIKNAVNIFRKNKNPLAILQTTSVYPCDYKDINLGVIDFYKKFFKVPIGISDHSVGIYTALGAVAKGACIVEKHFTLNKKLPGPDQKLSLEPLELHELVKGCRAVKLALGTSKTIISKEKPILKFARESVVSTCVIKKDEKITKYNISTKRPGTGKIPAKDFYKIIGKHAQKNIAKNKQLSLGDIH